MDWGAAAGPAVDARSSAAAVARFAFRHGATLPPRAGDAGPAMMDIEDLAKSASQLGAHQTFSRLCPMRRVSGSARRGDIYLRAASDLPSESEKRLAVARESAEFLGHLASP